ncbi:hypothetical protein [Sphingomonas sp.]|uniref:hypothetical protein n=1 Tax=Sphingomonas sp. TaxID=28214 RepID=UPI003B008518
MSPLPADRARAALIRALKPVAGPFAVVAARSQDWASATFEGARHRLALRLEGEDADTRAARLVASLAAVDVPMDNGFVADIAVTARVDGDGPVLGIEALTIREAPPCPAATISGGARRCG